MQEDFYYIAAIYSTKKVEIYMNNSEIHQTYNRLWSQALQSIQTNSLRLDSNLLNKPGDSRRGFTLICRPSQRVQHSVMEFLKEAQQIEPNQYYYKSTELHTTVLSIITCNADFKLSEIDIAPYVEVLHQSIKSISSFNISYRGITASPDSIMIQGFPNDSTLEELRQNIRENFRKSGIKSTLDQRYKTHTAHMTCLRFQDSDLKNSDKLLWYLNENRDFNFGTSEITNLEFVLNDWYMSDEKTEVLQRYSL